MNEVIYRIVCGGQVPATDGFVVVMEQHFEDGTVTTTIVATYATEAEAQAEADRRNKIT